MAHREMINQSRHPAASEAVVQAYTQALQAFERQLVLKNYSPSTQSTYTLMFRKFLRAQFPKPLYQVGTDDVENYHAALIKGNTVSSSYINQSINAIKFYLEQVLGLARQHYALTRPVRSKQLPRVLSQGEIAKLLGTLRNVKHRAMLTLIYSSGLRISELINMKIEDVDSQNMRLWVRNAKGRKDRINAAGPTHFTAAAAILQGLRA